MPGFPAARDPLALAGATLYLPTRRACRLARDLFLDVTGEGAAILPRIVPSATSTRTKSSSRRRPPARRDRALELPQPLGGLERRLLLAQLVRQWASGIAPDKKGEAALVANNPPPRSRSPTISHASWTT